MLQQHLPVPNVIIHSKTMMPFWCANSHIAIISFICRYNDVDDEHRATDLMITANEDFSNIQYSRVTVSMTTAVYASGLANIPFFLNIFIV